MSPLSNLHRLAIQLAVAAMAYSLVLALDGWSRYGLLALLFLAGRLVLVASNRVAEGDPLPYAVVVPAYNETPASLHRCLWSIAWQRHRPVSVVLVDDCSDEWPSAVELEAAQLFAVRGVEFRVVHLPYNMGKREAIAVGRAEVTVPFEVLVCVDSDTDAAPDACARLTAAFNDPKVEAATGLVVAANRSKNLLTRLIDVRYVGAFEFDRASQSALWGSMVCVCGSLGGYRLATFDRWSLDFTTQTFAGERCTFGDDRRLTSYALRSGRAVYVRDAVARTDVPETLSHFTRQQVRWSRSWGRESLLALAEQPWLRPGRWVIALETVTWVAFTASLLNSMIRHLDGVSWSHIAVIAAAAVARSGAYAHRSDLGWGQRLLGMILAPAYSVLNVWVLLPLRLYALATMRRSGWGTRQHVEAASVSMARIPASARQ